ncbi:MAG: penicillin-binding transpeptidase domain-containing protein [Planctomycetota bacterium]
MFRYRNLRFLLLFYLVALTLVLFRLFQIQIWSQDLYERNALMATLRQSTVALLRGSIQDREGNILARSSAAYDLEVRPNEIKDLTVLAEWLELSSQEIHKKWEDLQLQYVQDEWDLLTDKVAEKLLPSLNRQYKTHSLKELVQKIGKKAWEESVESWKTENPKTTQLLKKWASSEIKNKYYLLIPNLSYDLACRLRMAHIPGIQIQAMSRRIYTHPNVAPHLLGTMGLLNREEYEEKKFYGYLPIDPIGRTGIERCYEEQLRGPRGLRLTEFNKESLQRKILFEDILTPNQNVSLTIDLELQAWTESVLDASTGDGPGLFACVIMRVDDGQILTMASRPRYSLSEFSTQYEELVNDPNSPLLNRCIQNRIIPNPGSVFKLLTAIAILEENVLSTPSAEVHCKGYLFNPKSFRCHVWASRHGGHGGVTLEQAIERSCNIFFYHYGEQLGIDKLAFWAKKFGFGQKTKVEVDHESRGLIPTPEWKKKTFQKRSKEEKAWTVGETRLCAIGQKVEVTPLQIARLICAIGNGGYLVQPHLVHQVGKSYRNEEPLCHPETLKRVREGMRLVVEGSQGTAQRYGLQKYGFAAKTGTADTKKGKPPHAWLAGYAPQNNPEYALVILAEYAGHGGEICGPLAKKILDKLFERTTLLSKTPKTLAGQ